MAQSLATTGVAHVLKQDEARAQGRCTAASRAASLSSKAVLAPRGGLTLAPRFIARSRVSFSVLAAFPAKPMGPVPRPSGGFSGWKPGQYPDPELIAATIESFPEKGVASVEEAMALYLDDGYKILDIRSVLEVEEEGRVGGSYNIPIILCEKKYNPEIEKKEVVQTANPEFLETVRATFSTDEKIIIMCSNGRQRAMQALAALDDAGYTNIVGMKGGYNYFYYVFDNKFRRRDIGRAKTVWSADGTTGIFASGVNFLMSDGGDEGYVAKDEIEYIQWADAVKATPQPAAAAFQPALTPETPSTWDQPTSSSWDVPAQPAPTSWDPTPAPAQPAPASWDQPAPATWDQPAPTSWDPTPAPAQPTPTWETALPDKSNDDAWNSW